MCYDARSHELKIHIKINILDETVTSGLGLALSSGLFPWQSYLNTSLKQTTVKSVNIPRSKHSWK